VQVSKFGEYCELRPGSGWGCFRDPRMVSKTEVETPPEHHPQLAASQPRLAPGAQHAMRPARGAIHGIPVGLMTWALLTGLGWAAVHCWSFLHGH